MADNNGNGNGNGKLGPTIPLEELDRPDGIISTISINGQRNQSGVLQGLIHAIENEKDYRQELKTANFSSPKKALQAVKAIHSLKACGVPTDEIVDAIIALKAGVNMAFVHEILQALTHTTFTTNYQQTKGKKKDNDYQSNSPLS